MFSEDQLEQLRSFPEISRDELVRYFTPTAGGVAFVDTGCGGPAGHAGPVVHAAVAGFAPDQVRSAPTAALTSWRTAWAWTRRRTQTRMDHLAMVAGYLRWKTAPAGSEAMKELEQFLLGRAMEHDSPTLLFSLALRVPAVGRR